MRRISKSVQVVRREKELWLPLPTLAVNHLKLKEGDRIHITIGSGEIVLRRGKPQRKWSEAELLKGVTPQICGPDLVPDIAGNEIF